MPILKTPASLIFFVHIPKTGGSSIEDYLRTKGSVSFHNPKTLHGFETTPQHFHNDLITGLFDGDFFEHRFAVLRDPLARLISEFRWRAKTPDPKYARFGLRDLSDKGKFLIRGNKKFLIRGNKKFLNFDQWVAYVFSRYENDPYICGNHIRPQHEFLSGTETLFRFENGLTPVYRWIDTVTDTPPSADPEHLKKGSFSYPNVSAETDRAVRAFYAEDFKLLDGLAASSTSGDG